MKEDEWEVEAGTPVRQGWPRDIRAASLEGLQAAEEGREGKWGEEEEEEEEAWRVGAG